MYPMDELGLNIHVAKNISISVEGFEKRFGSIKEHEFNYVFLKNHENTTPAWEAVFDDWKDKGILN